MITVSSAHAEENVDEHHVPGCISNSLHRLQAGCGWGFAIALILVIVTPSSSMPAEIAQMSLLPNPAVEVVVRPCKSGSVGSKRAKGANNRSQKPGDESGDTTSVCIEVHSTAIEVQEYLQAYGRQEKWNLIDEHVAEDAWTFSRKLEKEELLRYSKNDASTDHVSWTSGVAFVEIKTMELAEGFVRVQIAARFQGYGQNADRFAPPKEFWPLISNGTLENHLISVLEAHFKNLS
jgi:hypothetical protein